MKSSRRFAVLACAVCFFIAVLHISKQGKLLRQSSNADYGVPTHVADAVQERSNQRSDQQEPQQQQDGSSANSTSASTSANAVQKDQVGGGLPPAAATEPSPPEEPEPSPVPRGQDSYTMKEMCSSSSFSASQIWQQYLPKVINASMNTDVPEGTETASLKVQLEKLHTLLEHVLPPSRLRKGVRNLPSSNHGTVKHIVEKLQKRVSDPDNNPPLQIAVFGGSVTLGRECYPYIRHRLAEPTCAWPFRLEKLINEMFGKEVVKITNLALGGTGSNVGTRMVKYWMFPEALKESNGPDVIINSYSTNDGSTAPTFDFMIDAHQNFIRAALESKACDTPPLVISVDDYLGNARGANDHLSEELVYAMAAGQVAKWYDTVSISYADVVRDIVYKDTSDKTFFKYGDVHFGHLGHQTVAWTVAFALLELLGNYCDDEQRLQIESPLNNETKLLTSVPILPPPLADDLYVSNITKAWSASENGAYQDGLDVDCANMNTTATRRDPCITAWVAQTGNGFGGSELQNFLRRHQSSNDGWGVEKSNDDGWANKVGYVSNKPNATITFEFKDIATHVKVVTIFFLRSYGEKWKDSKARFSVTSSNNETAPLGQLNITGVHDMPYSLTLSEKIVLADPVEKGQTLHLKVDLISGSSFKITGMALCEY